jgi:DNA-binding CsgD family transcriptional regulator/PAS domain-containing protein
MPLESVESALSEVIGDIYDAAIDPTMWRPALESSCRFVGASSAALFWHDAATERSEALHLCNEDPHYTRLYFEKYVTMNPMFPAATFVETGRVHTSGDIMPWPEFEKTRFFREWVKPQGIVDAIAVNLEKGPTRSSFLNFRMDVTYGRADEVALNRTRLLVPHFQRAVEIGRLFDQGKAVQETLTETLDHVEAGVFLVAGDGRIAFANAAAKALLGSGTLLRESNHLLTAVVPEANRLLKDIFVAAKRGDASVGVRGVAVPLSASAQDRWFAHVLPLTSGSRQRAGERYAAVAAVLIRKTSLENPTRLEALSRLYKFTAGEVRVLDAVLKVGSIKAMAEMLGISQATVKTHLHNVFRKTGAQRRSDLVKLIAGL